MLTYTLQKLMEAQRAELIRDMSGADEFGGEPSTDWQPLATVPCCFYWRKESSRGPGKEIASAQRTVAISEGGLIMGPGTDVTDRDRILKITDPTGTVLVADGLFQIIAVFSYPDHVEAAWIRP